MLSGCSNSELVTQLKVISCIHKGGRVRVEEGTEGESEAYKRKIWRVFYRQERYHFHGRSPPDLWTYGTRLHPLVTV